MLRNSLNYRIIKSKTNKQIILQTVRKVIQTTFSQRMNKKELQESWKFISKVIKNKNTFDIGFLHRICNLLEQEQQSDKATQFIDSVIQFLNSINDKSRKTSDFSGEYLALIVIDSVIFNIYARHKNTDKNKLNNSFYNSMSMSQMSVDMSEQMSIIGAEQDLLKKVTSLVQSLACNDSFCKKLKLFYDRNHHRDKNHHYLQNLLETIDYILNKQKLTTSKETFLKNKQQFKKFVHNKQSVQIDAINKVIFSNQLNKIIYLLTNAPEEVFFALNRIYFVGKKTEERKHFKNVNFNANDMTYNLNKMYIESFSNKMEIFQESKNPLFILAKTYLFCFYLPIFKRFCQIIIELSKNDYDSMLHFYKTNEQLLQKYLIMFIDELPLELVQYLNSLYRIIQRHYKKQSTQGSSSSMIPIKRLFLYSFLVDPNLIKQYYAPMDLDKFEQICNFVINLFFTSSLKKYSSNYSVQQLSTLIKLCETIQHKFQDKIVSFDQNYIDYMTDENVSITSYFIEEPILNHDYNIISEQMNNTQFTPKDLKAFQMRKQSQIFGRDMLNERALTDSPVLKYIKKDYQFPQAFQPESIALQTLNNEMSPRDQKTNQQENIDFLTWMSIGGNHDYSQKRNSKYKIAPKKERKFVSFNKQRVKQINHLYQEYNSKNIY